jgi:hypothetical protein
VTFDDGYTNWYQYEDLAACSSDPNLPKCSGDRRSWNAGYGGCTTYEAGRVNHLFCAKDVANGLYADEVCQECGACDSADSLEESEDPEPCTSWKCRRQERRRRRQARREMRKARASRRQARKQDRMAQWRDKLAQLKKPFSGPLFV